MTPKTTKPQTDNKTNIIEDLKVIFITGETTLGAFWLFGIICFVFGFFSGKGI